MAMASSVFKMFHVLVAMTITLRDHSQLLHCQKCVAWLPMLLFKLDNKNYFPFMIWCNTYLNDKIMHIKCLFRYDDKMILYLIIFMPLSANRLKINIEQYYV